MSFPDHIAVTASYEHARQPAIDLAVMIKIKTGLKNGYTIGPKFTDDLGVATFSKPEIIGEMEALQESSPMDYSGNIEQCKCIEAIILGQDAIERLVKARETWGVASPRWSLNDATRRALQHAHQLRMGQESIRSETTSFANAIAISVPQTLQNPPEERQA